MTEYFSIRETMKKMKMSRSTIMRLIKQGKLQTHQPGGENSAHKITQEQIDKCIQGGSEDDNRSDVLGM